MIEHLTMGKTPEELRELKAAAVLIASRKTLLSSQHYKADERINKGFAELHVLAWLDVLYIAQMKKEEAIERRELVEELADDIRTRVLKLCTEQEAPEEARHLIGALIVELERMLKP